MIKPESIRVLAIGDVVGRAGRKCLSDFLPQIRARFSPDLVIVNGENSAGGFGITQKIVKQYLDDNDINVITTGNHWHDKSEIYSFKQNYPQLVVPANMYNVKTVEEGYYTFKRFENQITVINLTGRVFMKGENHCPFKTFDSILERLGSEAKMIIVDFHGEASSEKQAFAHYVKDRCSLLFGTHTHCPTADERIFDSHLGYITDLGMTGAYDSVIGITAGSSLNYFLGKEKKKFEPAKSDPWLCGVIADIDLGTGGCKAIQRIKWTEESQPLPP